MSQIKRYIHAIKHYAKTIERYISPIVKHLYFILAAAKRVVLAGPIVLNVLLAFSLHPFLCAQENVEGSLDKNKAFIGDIITFTVKAQLPKDAQIRASQNFRFNDFDIVNSNVKHIPASENTYQLTFNIAAYKLGRLTINPIKVLYINSKGNDD
jgi:hypothetical protein